MKPAHQPMWKFKSLRLPSALTRQYGLCAWLSSLFSWIALCLLRTRPLSTSTYAYNDELSLSDNPWKNNEKWYLAACIFQAIAGLSVIPTSSAHAAAVHAQRNHITLRQLLFIADGTYASPRSYLNIITNFYEFTNSWVRGNATGFWALAALLHIIGAVIWPIQAGVVSSRAIKVQGAGYSYSSLTDLADFNNGSNYVPSARSVAIAAARAMEDYEWHQSTSHLWVGGTCPEDYSDDCVDSPSPQHWTEMPDPFFAELSPDSNSGLTRQFAPRVNLTTEFTCLNRSTWKWPAECDDERAMVFDYHGQANPSRAYTGWSFRLCMLPDLTSSPWKATRGRQVFNETLYINVTGGNYDNSKRCIAKIDVKTTAGMFEMSNYMNDGRPGPLLANAPVITHDSATKRE